MKHLMVMIAVLTLPAGAAIAGGDAEAGKAIFEGNCGSCHYEDDFAGKSSADILSLIKTQAAPDSKHKGDLSALGETEMADVAAFLASFGD